MDIEMTARQLAELETDSYSVIDIRDSSAFEYGHISGAVNIPQNGILSADLPADKKLVICCKSGIISREIAETLRERGLKAYNLSGGYVDWLRLKMENRQITADVEQSLRKKFKKSIFCRFTKAINEYQLVKPGDRICVCISGGKDSMLMAKLFQELKRHDKFPFEVKFLVMDPGYSPENMELIRRNAESMSIPIEVFQSDIFESVFNIEKNPCYICARMRRGYLYSRAKAMGCNKIALGHHFDDVIETILMGMIYGGQVQTMMPKLHSRNFKGMELIRPLYMVREEHIKQWVNYNELEFIACACRLTERLAETDNKGGVSKRQEIKELIAKLAKGNDFVETNIFKSVYNVNLRTVIEYEYKGKRYNFLDKYDEYDWEQDRIEQGIDEEED